MTVKFYVSQDSEGDKWAPDHTHEVEAVQQIARQLWQTFHHRDALYVIISNLHNPSADLVICTEHGLGVVELKHVHGVITMDSGGWYADNGRIKAGRHENPQIQVRSYAQSIREKILPYILPKDMRTDQSRWSKLKFQTCVCFTNPAADSSRIREQLSSETGIRLKPWEHSFKVIAPQEMPAWVDSLRFGVDLGPRNNFEPYKLKRETIVNTVQLALGAVEWSELVELMPDGEPWGYLVIEGDDQSQRIGLRKDVIIVGRDPGNDVVVPQGYRRVGRVHARITRKIGSVVIEDLSSKNGSFINSEIIVGERQLRHDQTITLGDSKAGRDSYQFRFRSRSEDDISISVTKSQ